MRTITFYTGENLPGVSDHGFARSQKISLTKTERNGLKKLTAWIVEEYASRVLPLAAAGESA